MKIDYELTDKDYSSIANIVIKKMTDENLANTIIETSRKVAEQKYWHIFDKNNQEGEIRELVKKYMGNIIVSAIKEGNLLEKEVIKSINTEELKKLGAKRLRDIAYQLEKEAEDLD